MEPRDSWRHLATEESIVGLVNLLTSSNPSEQVTLKTTLVDQEGNVLYPAGNPARLSGSITRPANQLDYAIGDNIGTYVANVKQKETVTLVGEAGVLNISIVGIANRNASFVTDLATTAANFVTNFAADFLPTVVVTNLNDTIIFESATAGVSFLVPVLTPFESDLDGTVVNVVANRVAVKEKWTVTLTGQWGPATITGAGGLTKIVTFDTTLANTADAFATANAVDYNAAGITLDHVGDTLTFESNTAGVAIVAPIITSGTSTLSGTLVHTTANNAAVAQVDIVTLAGTEGTANMTVVGGLTKLITFAATLKGTADAFVLAFAGDYDAAGVVVTAGATDTLIFTAKVAGVALATAVVVPIDGITGTTANSVPNETDIAQVETLTLTGTSGAATITAAGGLTKTITYVTSPTATAEGFVTTNAGDYDAQDIVLTSSGADLIFTAKVAGTGFTAPVITTLTILVGTPVHTQVNVTAISKVDKVTLTGTIGYASVTGTGGLTTVISAISGLEAAAQAFVTANAADYTAQGITVTSNYKYIWFSAIVPGTTFTSPTITTLLPLEGEIAHSTANATITALPLVGASITLGGGGTIKGFKLETDDVTFAEKIVRVWLLNAVPTGVVGDNVAFVINFADASKRLAVPYVDITFGALLAGSTSVLGKTDTEIQYVCSSTDNKLYVLLQTLSTVVAPKSAGVFQLDINVLKLT